MVTLYLVSAPVNILTDLIILFLPMPLLTGLTLPPKQRIILIASFALGGFVTVVDVMQIAYLQEASTARLEALSGAEGLHYAQESIFWYAAPPCMWSTVEVNVGIICACSPVLKPLLVRLAPRFFGSLDSKAAGNTNSDSSMVCSQWKSATKLSNQIQRPLSNSF
jgi:hypothetical protein